jgi:hypothetical protein
LGVGSRRLANNDALGEEMIMKTLATVIVALSVVAGIASAPASAFDAKRFWQDYDRTHSPAG